LLILYTVKENTLHIKQPNSAFLEYAEKLQEEKKKKKAQLLKASGLLFSNNPEKCNTCPQKS